MASTHDESEDTASSLGDSSYDFIDDRSNVATDDEEQDAMTASTTSSDEHDFDQPEVRSQGSGQADRVNQPTQGHGSSSSSNNETSTESSPTSSGQTGMRSLPVRETQVSPNGIHEAIEFEEPSVINLNSSRFTEVSHTLQMLDKQEPADILCNNLLDRLQPQMAVTVRQTMTSHSLAPEGGSYKVLYVGDSGSRDSILQKIGTALATGLGTAAPGSKHGRSSKFSVVPISGFGEESSPEVVLIDSSGLELIVEDCNWASYARKDDGNDTLRLELAYRLTIESSWTGSEFAMTAGWKAPDLAIFVVPEDDNFGPRRTRQAAQSFMSRHAIPSIVISQTSQWDKATKDPVTLDYLTPHVCLEARHPKDGHGQIIRRFPIDLATFLHLDPGQLNRNLACLSVAYGPKKSRTRSKPDHTTKKILGTHHWSFKEAFDSFVADIRKEGVQGLNRYEYLATLLVSLLAMMAVGVGLTSILGASKVSNSRVFPPTDSVVPSTLQTPPTLASTAPLVVSSTSIVVASSASSTHVLMSPSMKVSKSLSTNTDIASFLLDAYTLAPNKSEQFKVHVLGDCHIVLRPPHWFSKMKRAPKLLFKVLRDDTEIEHEITTLFEGVYALQIPREDAYGMLNVMIRTESKPKISESFEVDLGSSWLKVAGWRKATRAFREKLPRDLSSVQTSLSVLYDHTKTDLSTWVQQQKKRATASREAERAIIRCHRRKLGKTTEVMLAQTKDLAHNFATRFNGSKAITSRRIQENVKDLIVFTRDTTAVVSRQARVLAHAATGVDVKAFAREIGGYKRKQLRDTQKAVLKTLWKIGGAPKPKKTKVDVKTKVRSRGGEVRVKGRGL
ncbi:hypothetical protein P7C71_g1416, partial [Lecanoromycetidae sp. Uapishka_2]